MKKFILILGVLILTLPIAEYGEEVSADKTSEKPSKSAFKKADIKRDVPKLEPNIPEEYSPLIAVYDKYWKFIKEGDFSSAYELESNDYKKVVSLREYRNLQKRSKVPVNIKAIRALGVEKKGEKEVIVKGTMWLKAAEIDTLKIFNDKWVKAGEEWRHVREVEDVDVSKKDKQ